MAHCIRRSYSVQNCRFTELGYTSLFKMANQKLRYDTIRYDTIVEFNVDSKAEYIQLNLAQVDRN